MIGSYRDIILAPVITEKAAMIAANGDKIVFKVKKDANKTQIKQAIEKIYNVKVVLPTEVNTYDLVLSDNLLITEEALKTLEEVLK